MIRLESRSFSRFDGYGTQDSWYDSALYDDEEEW